ncbi:MAG: hypothetical protein LBL75_02325 [Rickettsiales bacterium]|jgi:hypothetical protein|nr:hypothetical protein [Rickettsiales bacterium]
MKLDNPLKTYYIAYFDILGYKLEVKKQEVSFFIKMIAAMIAFHSGISTMYKIDEKAVKNNIINSLDSIIKYNLFSDNFILYVPISENNRENTYNLHKLLDACLNTQCHFCRLGLKLRGGITIGNMFANKEIVFGSGLIKSVALEEQAEFPIIIIDKDIQKHCQLEIPIITLCNKKFLNYLEYYRRRYLNPKTKRDKDALGNFLQKHKELINSIKTTKNIFDWKSNKKLKRKKNFLINYHNDFCKKHNFSDYIF